MLQSSASAGSSTDIWLRRGFYAGEAWCDSFAATGLEVNKKQQKKKEGRICHPSSQHPFDSLGLARHARTWVQSFQMACKMWVCLAIRTTLRRSSKSQIWVLRHVLPGDSRSAPIRFRCAYVFKPWSNLPRFNHWQDTSTKLPQVGCGR